MTEHEDRQESTADLADAILRTYRERKAAVVDDDVDAVDELADAVDLQAGELRTAAARLRVLMTELTSEPGQHLDVYAVLRSLSEAAGDIAAAAAELRRQERFDLPAEGAWAEWDAALAGLSAASASFQHAADGWA